MNASKHSNDLQVSTRASRGVVGQCAEAICSPPSGSKIARGVRYQSRKSNAAPFVSKAIVSGTFSRIWGKAAPDIKIKRGGRPAEKRFPKAIRSPHPSITTGAKAGPTEAMPSVANSEALKLPS